MKLAWLQGLSHILKKTVKLPGYTAVVLWWFACGLGLSVTSRKNPHCLFLLCCLIPLYSLLFICFSVGKRILPFSFCYPTFGFVFAALLLCYSHFGYFWLFFEKTRSDHGTFFSLKLFHSSNVRCEWSSYCYLSCLSLSWSSVYHSLPCGHSQH